MAGVRFPGGTASLAGVRSPGGTAFLPGVRFPGGTASLAGVKFPGGTASLAGVKLPAGITVLAGITAPELLRPASAAAFRTMTAVFLMAVSVETAQAHQLPEAGRKVIVEKKDTVFRADKGPGDPHEEPAVYPVQPLGQPAVKAGQRTVMFRHGPVEGEGQAEILHRDLLRRIACLAQPFSESSQHFRVIKADACLQTQIGRAGEYTR